MAASPEEDEGDRFLDRASLVGSVIAIVAGFVVIVMMVKNLLEILF